MNDAVAFKYISEPLDQWQLDELLGWLRNR
jgi:hypothetical protein